ncbi:hypothetical protein [Spirosoma fluviale]|uniref:Uncharacterized protein n=1 Tax=Spirosoma fluviale TaxID=1597977 RepID=A0A286GNI4_9BACT|nr:hypothetical protein [Spirosoma fluviale]SOD97111.1 hypothetical protein SAMN06269250_5670 [Spirosoma fluviale]
MSTTIPTGLTQQATDLLNQQPNSPDPNTVANLARDKAQAELASYLQDMHERRKFARYIFWMVALWLLGIFSVVVFKGLKSFKTVMVIKLNETYRLIADIAFDFDLSDTVMVALITTTTINVAAFFLAVTKYLFPSKPESSQSQ